MLEVSDQSQAIGEFLEWLMARVDMQLPGSINQLLADFYDIDLDKVEREKRSMLADIRRG